MKEDNEFFEFDVAFVLEGHLRLISAGPAEGENFTPSFPSLFIAKGRAVFVEKRPGTNILNISTVELLWDIVERSHWWLLPTFVFFSPREKPLCEEYLCQWACFHWSARWQYLHLRSDKIANLVTSNFYCWKVINRLNWNRIVIASSSSLSFLGLRIN